MFILMKKIRIYTLNQHWTNKKKKKTQTSRHRRAISLRFKACGYIWGLQFYGSDHLGMRLCYTKEADRAPSYTVRSQEAAVGLGQSAV